ncbi:MAG TPA: PAS domain S-box protein, partial [Abditibacteriaceae bacterium]
ITGFTAEEAIGQSGEIIFRPEDRAAGEPKKEIQTATKQGRAIDERWHLRQSGERFWASGALMAMCDEAGNLQGFIKIFRDATEQKLAAQELKTSETRFRTLSDAIPQLAWTNNAQGEADYFNRRWHDYSGLSYEESYGLGWQRIVHPDDAPASVARWEQAQAEGEVFDTEYRLRRADGTYRWNIGRNVPLRNEAGEVVAWFGTATDIEELKQAQEAIWQAHDELEQRVQERTAQLKHTSQAREQLMERLVNVQEEERHRISRELHDVLGQELTALLMRLQVLPEWPQPEALQPERRRSSYPSYPQQVENLRGSVKGLIELVQRLAWEMRPAELDNLGLPKALEQYVEEWRSQYDTRAAFVHNYPKDTLNTTNITGPMEIAIYRVVQEALTNVQRHAQAQNVSVILEKSQSTLTAIVEDDGQGFDTEKDEQGNERPASHRLGLLGMQERMEIVGGTLTIESRPGQGTTVYARVPLSPV